MRLSSIHRYWLSEINKRQARGLIVGDYSGTSHEFAIEGLINLGYCKVKKQISKDIKIVEITSSGKKKLVDKN